MTVEKVGVTAFGSAKRYSAVRARELTRNQ